MSIMSKAAQRILSTILVAGLLIVSDSTLAIAAPGYVALAQGKDPASNQVSMAKPASNPFTETLIGSLMMHGFQVSQGYPKLYTMQDCIDHTYPSLKNCFGANPAAPYVIPVVQS